MSDASSQPSTQPSTPRAAPSAKPTTPHTEAARKKKKQMSHASTLATHGSNTLYATQAPFGTSVSRFSPSMTFAHHVPSDKKLPRGKQPNRKWVPPTLGEDGQTTLGELAGTPASGKLSSAAQQQQQQQQQQEEERSSVAGEAPPSAGGSVSCSSTSTSGVTSSSASRAASSASSGGRPRSAGADQKLSRALRQEITAMRDAKLQAIREGSEPPTPRDSPRAPLEQPRTMSLDEFANGGVRYAEDPLARLERRVIRIIRHPPPGTENAPPAPPQMTLERASLLSFVAGEDEVRTR